MLDKTKIETQKRASKNSPTDEELIKRFQEGDVYAFEQIVHRYKDPLVNFIYHFVGNRVDAEDIVQETFLRVFKKKDLYRSVAKFSTWIYTIASNLAKTELRRRRRRHILSLSQMGYEDKDYELPDHFSSPEKTIERKTKEQTIRDEIEALPIKFKEVVVLRDIQEFSYEEISKILHIPLGTVKSRVNRGRLRLQQKLKHLLEK